MKFDFIIKKKKVLYAVYALSITLVFLYVLFPSAALKIYLTARLNRMHPDIRFAIAKLKPLLPPGVKLYQVDILYRDAALLELETVNVIPRLLSVFGRRTKVKFSGSVYGGRLDGQAEFSRDNHPGEQVVDGQIADLQLRRVVALEHLVPHKISGLLGGAFSYRHDGRNRSLTADMTVADSRLELADALFDQRVLAFKKIEVALVLENGTLTVRKCRLKGKQLDAEISGTIGLGGQRTRNFLNLKGSVTPHHVLMAKIENSLPAGLLKGVTTGGRAIGFKIGGTLDDPRPSLN